jgi:DNA helicase IV
MEKADAARAEQEELEEMQRQDKREQREQEWAEKEAELEEKEAKYIWQVNAKEINEARFWELVGELDFREGDGGECCGGASHDAGHGVGRGGRGERTG